MIDAGDIRFLLFYVITLTPFAIGLWLCERRERKRQAAKEAHLRQERQSAEELVLVEEDLKVTALRGYVRSSIQTNMLAMESLKRMDEVARMHCTGEPAGRDLQNDAWYRRAEGLDHGQNHRPL